jgi:conjugative relaxase-like TrwC/TraI family protein
LTLATLGPGAVSYLEETVARGVEDYYLGVKEAPGQWLGRSAARLGLDGEVDGDAFHRVLSHADPSTRARLTDGRSDPKVVGIDATFCAPKSVSLLHALGSGEVSNEVRNAHDAAVRAAVEFYEHAAQGRRGHGGVEVVEGEGFVAAAYRHRTSRAADPHLHTHVVVANLVYASQDGRWSALDGRPVFSWARTVGHLYNAQLRAELTSRLGVRWMAPRNGLADLEGIPRSTIDAFSTRRRQIEAALDAAGVHSAKAAQTAAYATRAPKDLSLDAQTLFDEWRSLAARHGLSRDTLDRLCGRTVGQASVPTPGSAEVEALYEYLASPDGLTEKRSTFDVRHVIEAVCNELPNGARVDQVLELAARFLASDHVVAIDGPDRSVSLRRNDGQVVPSGAGLCRYTTPEMIATEQRLLARAVTRRHARTGIATDARVDAAIAARPTMTSEQTRMARAICGSGAGVDIVKGVAGAGKTYALAAAREAWLCSGYTVTGCALAAKAAARLEAATGIRSSSLDRLLGNLDTERTSLSPWHVVVVDEAAMVGTRKLHSLLDHAERAGAKVVLIGDPCQLPEIEAGGAFVALTRSLRTNELFDNRRQGDLWERRALAHIRAGDTEPALEAFRSHGRIHDHGNVRAQLVTDWFVARSEGRDAVMLAGTHVEVDDLNRRAREMLQARGELGLDQLVAGQRAFAIGDEVLALRNDYPHALLNGTRLQVGAIDAKHRELTAIDELGARVAIPFAYIEAGHLTHAYAMTVHKAQGATVERAFVLAQPGLTAEIGYTALSRATERTDLYLETGRRLEREAHSPPSVDPSTLDRIAASLRQTLREPLAIQQGPVNLMPIGALRAERDALQQRLGPRPPDHRIRLDRLADTIHVARSDYEGALTRHQHVLDEIAEPGPLGRRLRPTARQDLEQRRETAAGEVDRAGRQLEHLATEHRRLTREQRAYNRWCAIHAPELDRLNDLNRVMRVAQALERQPKPTVSRSLERGIGLGL